MRCLYCGEKIIPVVSWGSLFSREEEILLCEQCKDQLTLIEGDCCVRCSRPFDGLAVEYRKGEYCYDCVRWEGDIEWNGILERNRSLYLYNDFLKEVISRYKFRGDYVLARFFCKTLIQVLKDFDYDLLVPIPLSQERLYERGFNQAEALIIEAGLTLTPALKRIHTEKQSKKSREERIHLSNIFTIVNEEDIVGKKVMLIDDIYTTGSTLMHAGKLLKQHGTLSVSSFTIARG
ncbi:ComF family protein [Robertmurraya korlensis]|uniref:ComF family protein n=1 Tax=Robertmurraya korlensis TaxID=519977 RepID=UPI00082457B6|nr:ComF family protein [Robertmurraya korlensis]